MDLKEPEQQPAVIEIEDDRDQALGPPDEEDDEDEEEEEW